MSGEVTCSVIQDAGLRFVTRLRWNRKDNRRVRRGGRRQRGRNEGGQREAAADGWRA